MTSALVIIDMQQWMFRLPERMTQVPALLSNITRLAAAFEASSLPIYDVRTEHKADRSSWSRLMLKYDYPCLLENTSGAAVVAGYIPPTNARKIIKTANCAFLRTDFEEQLRNDGVSRLVLTGVFVDGCVGLTAAGAAQRGFEVTFIEDGIGQTDAELRDPLLKWLIEDYELESAEAEEFIERLGSHEE